ncbi:MAG: restriction endonuclease subunit S [Candidatus Hydrogenedentes bacterium]|nr:restriction endonuclease subunit S [Candidatus Hydrogenedentota bacterium]
MQVHDKVRQTGLSRYKSYPAYVKPGIEWLGEIPSSWAVDKLKFNSHIKGRIGWQNLRADEFTSEGPYLVTGMHFRDGKVDWESCYHISDDRYNMAPEIQVRSGDVLVTKDGSVGKIAYIDELPGPTSLNSHLLVIRDVKGRYFGRFLFYLLDSDAFRSFTVLEQKGTTFFGITQRSVENFAAAFPPLDEQRAIATFLDRETGKIDALIAKKERLIALLQEKRTALITHAVTKGLDPNAPMKDSGVEWLGEIPAHWEVKRIKYLLHRIIDTEHKTAPFYPDGEYLVVRTSNVRSGTLDLSNDAKFTDEDGYIEWTRRGMPTPGDILFTREAPAGEACIVPHTPKLCLGQRMVLFKIDHRMLDGDFGVHALYGGLADEFIESLSQGSTVAHFNMSDIGNIPIVTPPRSEQTLIADYIRNRNAETQNLVVAVGEGINLLKEYRTALISAAVTGKIDVRD